MIPDFALSLSFEGISLSHRTAQGWVPLGEVPLDSRDLASDLLRLQKAGLASGTPWRGTKILLPPEQVRVVALDGERGEAEARAALEGLTPYAVAELVIDVAHRDGRTHVAAVAQETLAEAEAFADEHGFAPVCFAAALEAAGFPGEAFFGATAAASGILGDQPVLRDPATLAPGAVVLVREPSDDSVVEAVPVADDCRPEPVESVPKSESAAGSLSMQMEPATEPLAGEPAETSAAKADETVELAAPEVVEATNGTAVEEPAVIEALAEAAALSAPSASEPVFASRARPLTGQTRSIGPAPDKAPSQPSDRSGPPVGPTSRDVAAPAGWALSAPPNGRPDPRLPPRMPAPAASVPATSAPAVSAPVQPEAVAAPPREPSRPTPEPQAQRRGPFAPLGAEVPRQRIGGKPRFLGLILTAILLLLMASVALFAAGPERIAGLFRLTEPAAVGAAPPGTESSSTETAVAAAHVQEAPEALASAATAPLPQPGQSDPAAPASEAAAPVDAAAVLPQPAAPDGPAEALAPPPAASEAASAAVAAAIAALPGREEQAAASPVAPIDPTEADRFYAATGVWLRPPRPPALPEVGSAAAPDLPAIAPAKALPDLPSLAALSPDTLPKEGPAPVASDGVVAGTSGVEVVAGQPARVPPTRPEGEEAGEPALASAMAEPPSTRIPERPQPPAEVPGSLAVTPEVGADVAQANAMAEAPDARIPARPEAPPEMLAALDAVIPVPDSLAFAAMPTTPGLPAAMGGVSLAGLRPMPRPEGFAPELPEPEPNVLASFDGPRPGPRPDGLAPEDLPTADVSDALAEALAEPEAPVEPPPPAQPDLQSALAAIVEGAPDPLAGATRQAVAVARVPDVRPRNFGRVVESQIARQSRTARAQDNRAPAGGSGSGGLAAHEEAEAAGEAEVASSAAAAPSGPTATTVAQAATYADVIALREINLIGVYGQPGARRALVRMGNGRYLRVGVGDELDGGQVTVIGDNALNYVRRGRTHALVIPGG